MKFSWIATLALIGTALAMPAQPQGSKKLPSGAPCKKDGSMGVCQSNTCVQDIHDNQGHYFYSSRFANESSYYTAGNLSIGDTLTRWTNGKITGGIHRVTTPEAMKEESGLIVPPRMSMAYLFKAARNVSVGPLPKFVSSTEPAKFPDITALEFQRWRNSIVYNLDEKAYPNGVDDLVGSPKATLDAGVTDLVNYENVIQPVQPVLV